MAIFFCFFIQQWREVFHVDDQPLNSKCSGAHALLIYPYCTKDRYNQGADRQKTHCAHYTDKAFTSHSRGLLGGNKRGTCIIWQVFCSCHKLQWVSLSCTRTGLVPKKNDQEIHFFSCKYVFNRGKVTFQSLLLSLKKIKHTSNYR